MPPLQWAVFQAVLDPVQGSEQSGMRPVLVVSNDEFNQVMQNVTVLPMTSTQRHIYPAEVLLVGGEAGQPRDSIVLAHQIRTISRLRLRHQLGRLDDPALREAVRRAMRQHLDLR
ncbi:MAG: type II toxin-antitoxin system PemK/MazF family toxin [Chloroflexi bacterium]|nr:type II toxin-antitoxin system PemK/MazF family toxin [Chloroflexota bacterium]